MINKKSFNKLIAEMEAGDMVIITKSNGSECCIKKINVLQYRIKSDTRNETITNPQYDLLLE